MAVNLKIKSGLTNLAANSDISKQPSPSTTHLTWQHDTVNFYPQKERKKERK